MWFYFCLGLPQWLWRRKQQPTPVSLPGESHGQRSLIGYSPRGCKELGTTERLPSLTHSLLSSSAGKTLPAMQVYPWVGKVPWRKVWQPTRILALRILWTEGPDGLQSIDSQRIGQDWGILAHTQAYLCYMSQL